MIFCSRGAKCHGNTVTVLCYSVINLGTSRSEVIEKQLSMIVQWYLQQGAGVLVILLQCNVTVSYTWGPPGPSMVDASMACLQTWVACFAPNEIGVVEKGGGG